MKVTVSQFAPPRTLPKPLASAILDPGIAVVLEAGAAIPSAGTASLARPGVPGALFLGEALPPGSDKFAAVAFEALGLAPKSAKLFPQILAMTPLESQAAMRAGLVQLEKAAQEAVGKPAFEAGVFVIGAPEQVAKLTDGTLGATARLAVGGRLAGEGLTAFGPFVPSLAPSVPLLCDVLMLATGLSLAAHFVPVLAPHAPQFRTVSWVCRMADKTIVATAQASRQPGTA